MGEKEEKEVFIRRASGLTRVISPWDALIYAFCNPGPVYAFIYVVWASFLYPGAHMPAGVLMVLTLLPIMAVYWLFSVSMPRSGGEYLYVSRALHPALGLFACWTLTIVGISWTGMLTNWEVNWGIAPFFLNQGILTNNQALYNIGMKLSPGAGEGNMLVFAIGSILLLITFFNMWRGAKSVMWASWIAVIVSFIGLAAIVIATFSSSIDIFASRLGSLSGIDYNAMLTRAQELGWEPGIFSITATAMAGATYINLNTLGSTYTTNVAGEIKKIRRAQPLALFGSLFLFMLFWGIFYSSVWVVPGHEFYGALSYVDAAGESPFLWFPVANQLVVYMTSNPILIHLATLGFLLGNYGGMLGLSFGPVRNLFAWSFDRILPTGVSKVDRRGSPYVAVLLGGILAWIFFTINNFTPWLSYILFTITLWFAGWVVVGIAGMVFPYTRKDIFERSPAVVQKKLAGIPVISIVGFLTAAVSAWTVYSTTVPAITGLTDLVYLTTTVIVLAVIPFIIYYTAYFYWKAKGVPIELQFKEIPPD